MLSSGERRLAGVQPSFIIPCSDEAGFVEGDAECYLCPPANKTVAGTEGAASDAKKQASPASCRGWPAFCVTHQ